MKDVGDVYATVIEDVLGAGEPRTKFILELAAGRFQESLFSDSYLCKVRDLVKNKLHLHAGQCEVAAGQAIRLEMVAAFSNIT